MGWYSRNNYRTKPRAVKNSARRDWKCTIAKSSHPLQSTETQIPTQTRQRKKWCVLRKETIDGTRNDTHWNIPSALKQHALQSNLWMSNNANVLHFDDCAKPSNEKYISWQSTQKFISLDDCMKNHALHTSNEKLRAAPSEKNKIWTIALKP